MGHIIQLFRLLWFFINILLEKLENNTKPKNKQKNLVLNFQILGKYKISI